MKICQGLAIPEGYVIVGYGTSSACPTGTYLLRKEEASRPRKAGAVEPKINLST